MPNPLRWLQRKVEESFEERLERFEAFREHPRRHKRRGELRISPSKKLVWGTTLAILVFVLLFILELALILHLNEFNDDLVTGMLVILSWVGGTYFGRRG